MGRGSSPHAKIISNPRTLTSYTRYHWGTSGGRISKALVGFNRTRSNCSPSALGHSGDDVDIMSEDGDLSPGPRTSGDRGQGVDHRNHIFLLHRQVYEVFSSHPRGCSVIGMLYVVRQKWEKENSHFPGRRGCLLVVVDGLVLTISHPRLSKRGCLPPQG